MSRRCLSIGAAAILSVSALITGCGASSSGGSTPSPHGASTNGASTPGPGTNPTGDPKAELTSAVRSLSSGSALTTTLSLEGTSADLYRLSQHGGRNDRLTRHQADLIMGATLTVETVAPAGKTLAQATAATTPHGTTFALNGTSGATTYFSFIVTPTAVFAQVDLKDLLAVAGHSAEFRSIQRQAAAYPAFARDIVDGKYVSLPFATVKTFASFLEGALQGASRGKIPDLSQYKQLEAQIFGSLYDDVSVTRTSAGSTDVLRLSANIRTLIEHFLTNIDAALPIAASQINPARAASQVPSHSVVVQATVTGGALSSLTLDPTQFVPPKAVRNHPSQVALLPKALLSFSRSGAPIVAPPGATPITFTDLSTFFSTLGSTG